MPYQLYPKACEDASAVSQDTESTELNVFEAGTYLFSEDHLQYLTYHLRVQSEKHAKVPDFKPFTLPRRDKGNVEDYYMVMLMLFKPWRTKGDLDNMGLSWENAFTANSFSERQKELMNNFHLRYECLDSHNDYSQQRKASIMTELDIPFSMNEDMKKSFDENAFYDGEAWNEDILDDAEALAMQYREMNCGALTMIKRMMQAEQMMCTSGAINPLIKDATPIYINLQTGGDTSSSGWRDILKHEQEGIIQQRRQQALNRKKQKGDKNILPRNNAINEVKEVNQDQQSSIIDLTTEDSSIYITKCIDEFKLNEDQEHAFRIIATHATAEAPDQLKMYLGGMAGTGKSQVIKALTQFFKDREENYRLLCVAPTGSAAALINRSMYHSVLNINSYDSDDISMSSLTEINENLCNVDYMFLDEISMVDCLSLYHLCNRMCKARQSSAAFGGPHVIFAGDFAQLAPVSGSSLYSYDVTSSAHTTNSLFQQQATLGKALWHQFTTVVILQKNIRQTGNGENDVKFRKCLENMRYQSCTQSDIELLQARIVGHGPSSPRLSHPFFRNVSIITRWNPFRDQINAMSSD